MRQSRQTWSQFHQVQRQYQHLDCMMEQLGISPLAAARLECGARLQAARGACAGCRDENKCRRWLDAAIVLEAPPVFCPNAGFFADCRRHEATGPAC